MAGRGPAPKPSRRRRNTPARGEWEVAESAGWQHGETPDPPDGLREASLEAWQSWMQSWAAAHWTPDDLPGLHVAIRLYDQCDLAFMDPTYCHEGEKRTVCINRPNPTADLRQYMDNYGITPKGQQDRRWKRPEQEIESSSSQSSNKPDPYAHLRVVNE